MAHMFNPKINGTRNRHSHGSQLGGELVKMKQCRRLCENDLGDGLILNESCRKALARQCGMNKLTLFSHNKTFII